MKIAVVALTSGGKKLAEKLASKKDYTLLLSDKGIVATLADNWCHFDGFVCIMATGIVVRAIAPLLKDKREDPCVVVLDEKGQHVISLLSGHLGGGNQLAYHIANLTNGRAVITTASDTLHLVALDLWAMAQNLTASKSDLTKASSLLVNTSKLKIHSDFEVESLPPGLVLTEQREEADLLITTKKTSGYPVLCPRNLVVGVGCNRDTPLHEFEQALAELFSDLGLSVQAVRNLASIDVKDDERGLLQFADNNSWQIEFFSRETINTVTNVSVSSAALKAVGAIGVAEPTALLSANTNILLSRKRKWQNITMAVAQAPFLLSALAQDPSNT